VGGDHPGATRRGDRGRGRGNQSTSSRRRGGADERWLRVRDDDVNPRLDRPAVCTLNPRTTEDDLRGTLHRLAECIRHGKTGPDRPNPPDMEESP